MKKTITVLLFTLFILFLGNSCGSFRSVNGNGDKVSKTFDVADFSAIDASNAFNISVVVGKEKSVEIETDENLFKYIEIYVKNNTIYLELKDNINISEDINVKITTPSLTKIDLSGACKIDVKNISEKNFSVDVSGACKGTLEGEVKNLNMDLSGATKFNTVKLKARNLNIDISGASKLDVYCEGLLTLDASGASKIDVYGNPKTTKTNISGASTINYK